MRVPIDEVVTFDCITTHPTTGAVTDADSTPTFEVFEDTTDTDIGVGGNLTKRTSKTGNYRGSFTASAANGFEAGKWYNVVASATVNSIAGKASVMHFMCVPAETVAGVPKVDVSHMAGTAQTARDIGASVLLSNGTGAGQLKLASGYVAMTWADIAAPTTVVALTGTTVGVTTTLTNDPTGVTTLLSRLTSSRAGYFDNLNVGGAVASQADITALNQSASRRIIITTVGQYERPESGNTTYTVEARTYDGDGAAVNADSTPTLTATGIVTGDLSTNLSGASNPATGVYRWTYTVANAAVIEQVRMDVSAVISAVTFTLTCYTQVVDFVGATWTTADRTKLEAMFNKLPSKTYLVGTANSDGDVQMDQATGNFPGSVGSLAGITFPNNFSLLEIDGTGFVEIQDGSLITAKLGTFVLAKTTNITGFNDLSAAQVNAEADTALADYDAPTKTEMDSAVALLATNAQAVKLLAAVYDSASVAGSVITLSNGATLTVTSSGRVRAGG